MRPCAVRLPGCDGGGETTVFAHAPSPSKGLAHKSPDWWGADACHSCHAILDGRVSHTYTQDFLAKVWLRAIFDTLLNRISTGLIKID